MSVTEYKRRLLDGGAVTELTVAADWWVPALMIGGIICATLIAMVTL